MGSGISSRRGAGPFRGIALTVPLGAVAAARLFPVAHTRRVEGAADDLVTHAGEVLHPAAPDEHDRVLLQVVTDARDVGGDLDATRESDPRHLAQRRVRLLRCGRVDARAHAPALRSALEGRCLRLLRLRLTTLADQLLDGGHRLPLAAGRTAHGNPHQPAVSSGFMAPTSAAAPSPSPGGSGDGPMLASQAARSSSVSDV